MLRGKFMALNACNRKEEINPEKEEQDKTQPKQNK